MITKIIHKAYKTQLNPNNKQRTILCQHAGTARFVYNWGLQKRNELYETSKKSTNAFALQKEIVQLKKTKEFSWLKDVSKCVPEYALRNLDQGYKNFLNDIKKPKEKRHFRKPKFKSRKKSRGSFTLSGAIIIEPKRIKLPRIGWINLKESNYIPQKKPKSVNISERAGSWFISVSFEEELKVPENESEAIIGIDLGLKELTTLSDGKVFKNHKLLKKYQKKLQRLHRELSRKQKGSQNREKSKKRLSRLYYKIANIRRQMILEVVNYVVKTKPHVVVLEDLDVSGMLKNSNLAKSISDVSFSELRRIMEYKCDWHGIKLIIADRFFASSKKCSRCGHIKDDLKLSDRIYKCEYCGLEIDRDLNAAINLAEYGRVKLKQTSSLEEMTTAGSAGSNACGEVKVHDGYNNHQVDFDEAGSKQKTLVFS